MLLQPIQWLAVFVMSKPLASTGLASALIACEFTMQLIVMLAWLSSKQLLLFQQARVPAWRSAASRWLRVCCSFAGWLEQSLFEEGF
jgi:hypothetical protein